MTMASIGGSSWSPKKKDGVRSFVGASQRKFDVSTLPSDMLRVYKALEEDYGEEYGLLFVFTMRTAIELHRAWHMTLLTNKILQMVKDEFGLKMTWDLGVIRVKFRVDDGRFELHRKVPYDYDSEYQDLYYRITTALVEGHISIHEALNFQTEVKNHVHTARSGVFLRDFPGRLILYPGLAATCAVIFFNGNWYDAGIAALCGLATGLLEWFLSIIGGEAKILTDIGAGVTTGIIGGCFYRFGGENLCLSSVFLGTLYWFFYGTAFVLGLLEIIAGELETGVTRFIAVSVKTFVLCLGASFGLLMSVPSPGDTWLASANNCGSIDLDAMWWRVPLYLASSVCALGQYRFPVVQYWRGLVVQWVAYEVQYQVGLFFVRRSNSIHIRIEDRVDTAMSNILGAAAAVVMACILSWLVDMVQKYYYSQLLQRGKHRDETPSKLDDWLYNILAFKIKLFGYLRLGRMSEIEKIEFERRLKQAVDEIKDPNHPRSEIILSEKDEGLIVDTIVCAESLNIWAMLMPAIYQLVPGSMIARLWFSSIFPPPIDSIEDIPEDVFSNLMVISCSLALGLIVGFAFVQLYERVFSAFAFWESERKKEERMEQRAKLQGMYAMADDKSDDPDDFDESNGVASKVSEDAQEPEKEDEMVKVAEDAA